MKFCSVFQLNILRAGSDCKFLLTWGDRQQRSATVEYPAELDYLYEAWKYAYEELYNAGIRGKAEESVEFTPASVDWKNRVAEDEKAFLTRFQRWLGDAELLDIRRQIMSAAAGTNGSRLGNGDRCVDLLVACESLELEKLPWEVWEIAPQDSALAKIHIARTVINAGNEVVSAEESPRQGKPRILAIFADAPDLDLSEDKRALRSLAKVAKIEPLEFQPGEDADTFKAKLIEQLTDDRGWDLLFFAGHSEETSLTGGRFQLAPNAYLSMSEIEQPLLQAKQQGLRCAFFNSCIGLSIANSLIRLGLHQVLMSREKLPDRVAPVFLRELCDRLAKYEDIQDALEETCEYLKTEQNAYPSAYLIPSLFRHPSPKAKLFQLEPQGWKQLWRDWKPRPVEAIAWGAFLSLNLFTSLSYQLLHGRYFAQAVYRDVTTPVAQLFDPETTEPIPPVQLVVIDEESVYAADEEIEGFQASPMDRQYLANLVTQLADSNASVIGIDYLVDSKEDERKEQNLANAVQKASVENSIWSVFIVENHLKVGGVFNPKWSLQGKHNVAIWDVRLPDDATCGKDSDPCPFAYLLALSQLLSQKQQSDIPQPQLQDRKLQASLSEYLQEKGDRDSSISFIKQAKPPFGTLFLMDLSVPPHQVYDHISAREFLNQSFSADRKRKSAQQVSIITPGMYYAIQDRTVHFPIPPATNYWCNFRKNPESPGQDCLSKSVEEFTRGEALAYQVHHFLSQHRIILISDLWLVLLAALLGRWMTLTLLKQKQQQWHKKSAIGIPLVYGIIGLQLYRWPLVALPWLWPALMFWVYVLPILRRRSNV